MAGVRRWSASAWRAVPDPEQTDAFPQNGHSMRQITSFRFVWSRDESLPNCGHSLDSSSGYLEDLDFSANSINDMQENADLSPISVRTI